MVAISRPWGAPYGAPDSAVPLTGITRRARASQLTLFCAAVALLAGGPVLATMLLLGRPPLSVPTLAGLVTFGALAAAGACLLVLEAWLLARAARQSLGRTARVAAAGGAPLSLGWPLTAALYEPGVHHWFVEVESVRPAMALTVLLPTLALKVGMGLFVARERALAWCWRKRYVLAGATYAAAALAAKPSLWHIDLPGWFVPAAKLVLAGQPLAMYSVRADVMGTAAPLEHGPLTVLLYAPFVALAEAAGKPDFLRVGALFPLLGVLAIDCAMAHQATRAIRDLAPRVGESQLFGAFCLVLFSPLLWFSSVWLVHLESLNALLVIGALRLLARDRGAAAGACFGAAMLLKHSAALAAGPVLLALFIAGQRRATLTAGLAAAALTAIGLAPFALSHPQDFVYNYAGYDAIKPIYGLTIWKASYDSGLEPLIMRLDSALIGLLALGNAAAAALVLKRQGADVRTLGWIAVILGQIAWLGFATWQYPHYFVLAFVALLVWESAAMAASAASSGAPGAAGWPALTLLFLFVPYNLQAHFPGNIGKAGGPFVVVRAAAQLLFLYGCALAVWLRAARPPDTTPSAPRGAPPPRPA